MGPRKNLINSLKGFATRITVEYPIKRMILFGSRACGKPHQYSDVDLIIVSPKFKEKRWLNRSPPLYYKWNLNYPVDFICLTPEKLKEIILKDEARVLWRIEKKCPIK